MEFLTEYLVTALWFVAVLAGAYYADRVWSAMLARVYWILLAPGIAVHELSHAFACLIMGAKISKIKLFGPTGGEVVHGPPKIPVVGQTVISMAPIAGCAAVLALAGALLNAPLAKSITSVPMSVALTPAGLGGFVEATARTLWGLAKGLGDTSWTNWRTYAFVYAAICLGIALRPSSTDLKNSALGVVALGVLIAGLDAVFRAAWDSTAITDYVLRPIQMPLQYLVAFLGLVVLLTVLAWLLRLAVHQLTGPRPASARPEPPSSN